MKTTLRQLFLSLFLVGGLGVGMANASTIDFEGVAAPGTRTFNVTPYTEEGFTLVISSPGATSANNAIFNNVEGSNAHGNQSSVFGWCGRCSPEPPPTEYPPFILTLTGLANFDVFSIDFSGLSDNADPDLIDITGFIDSGETILSTIDPTASWSTYSFSGFKNLTKLTIAAQSSTRDMAMDNLVVSHAVPEPLTLILLGIGLTGIGWVRCKSNR